jgi:hypothetical protein
LTATVLEFRRPLPRPKALPLAAAFTCTKCDSDFFVLRADGSVSCGQCRALINNLRVEGKDVE